MKAKNLRHMLEQTLRRFRTRSKFPDEVQKISSEDGIKNRILSSSSKSCDLDPILTSVLQNCLDILITVITDIINISMETSTFPQNFKEAHVRPLIKKTCLPENELKNYNWLSFPKS